MKIGAHMSEIYTGGSASRPRRVEKISTFNLLHEKTGQSAQRETMKNDTQTATTPSRNDTLNAVPLCDTGPSAAFAAQIIGQILDTKRSAAQANAAQTISLYGAEKLSNTKFLRYA